jgi:hypothetical protein
VQALFDVGVAVRLQVDMLGTVHAQHVYDLNAREGPEAGGSTFNPGLAVVFPLPH